ncbi:MAG: hypothetical protein L3K04_00150 [Thermoplasmata archaeon]|nr:hypothetical protein [Thermoplasmata archaeon]MCI4341583.1 hypothetical protein [Thermoplasmata archaeon]
MSGVLHTPQRAGNRHVQAISKGYDDLLSQKLIGGEVGRREVYVPPPALVDGSVIFLPNDDPTRATMLELLRQLNRSEEEHAQDSPDRAKELPDLEGTLGGFWAVKSGQVSVRFALGLLLKNQMIRQNSDQEFSWGKGRSMGSRFAITTQGKQFLLASIEDAGRVK